MVKFAGSIDLLIEGASERNVTIKSLMRSQNYRLFVGERAMKSSVVERSVVSLEDAFWKGLQEIAERHDEPLSDRQFANLSSAIRLFALGFYGDEQGGMVA